MRFIEDPAERTTAATDAVLAVIALGGIGFLGWSSAGAGHFLKMGIWSTAIGLIGLASAPLMALAQSAAQFPHIQPGEDFEGYG